MVIETTLHNIPFRFWRLMVLLESIHLLQFHLDGDVRSSCKAVHARSAALQPKRNVPAFISSLHWHSHQHEHEIDDTEDDASHEVEQKNNQKKDKSDKNSRRNMSAALRWKQENVDKCASIWNLNEEEKEQLYELGKKLHDVKHWKNDPYEVVRFLKEFGTVKEAEKMFRQMIKWRNDDNIDAILETYHPPSLYRYFPVAIMKGVDRDGDPIHIERPGVADSIGLLERYGAEEMLNYGIWVREVQNQGKWQQEYEKAQGHPVRKFTVIIDMQGMDRKRLFHTGLMAIEKEVSRIAQDDYPGFTKRMIILRAPTVFRMAWSMFKPLVSKSLQDVMVFTTESDYKQVLEEYIDPKVMPSVILPNGKGQAVDEFNPAWEGGKLPEAEEHGDHEFVLTTHHFEENHLDEEIHSEEHHVEIHEFEALLDHHHEHDEQQQTTPEYHARRLTFRGIVANALKPRTIEILS